MGSFSTTDNTPSELGRGLRWGSGGDDLLASKSSVPGTRQPSFALSDVSEHRRTKRSGARDAAATFPGRSLFEHCAASPNPLGASGYAAATASIPHGSAEDDDDAQAFWRALRAGVDVHKHASPLPRAAAAEPPAACDGCCPRCATGHHRWSTGAAARRPGAGSSSESGGCSSTSEGGGGSGGRSARSARAATLPSGRRAVRALARLLHGPGPVQAGGEGMVTLFADRAQSSLCWCVPGQSVLSPDTRASVPIEDIIHMDIAPIPSPTTSAPRCLNPLPPTASPAATAAVTPIATDVTLWTASRALRFTIKGRQLQDLIVSGLQRMVDANRAAAARRVAVAAAAEAPPHTAPLLSAALLRERLQRYAVVGAATTPSSASPPHRQRQPPPPPQQQQQPLRPLACTAASDDVLPPSPQGQLPPALAIAAAAQGWGGALPYARSSSSSSGTASPCDTPQHAVNFVSAVPFGPAF
ncbi:hypothetical protein JKP88DRAFT_276771 [Tribonema minus]|uniref:Uncharacterized protein n=1 Tax=Tribonema minus TaxID=303371 RepID=A0A835ZAI7_9STRA|nr:hypothetical protein JKP88DRAFT_276771 [Tribonema minus]